MAHTLRENGHQVLGLDRTFAASDVGEIVDLTNPVTTADVFARFRPDAVVHLAAIAVPFSAPERTIFTVNTTMAFTVIEAAVAAGASRVLVASSPTVLGYGRPDWEPARLPLDEQTPTQAQNAYSLSKVCVEESVATFARHTPTVRFAAFRPCYVISPEEWSGALTQQGHTVIERLEQPGHAAVSLFNYVDARDVGDFVQAWLTAENAPSGATYFVGADDALALEPLADLLPRFHPRTARAAQVLVGTAPAFSSAAATRDLGWAPKRSWRTELPADEVARLTPSPASPLLSKGSAP